MIPISTIIDAAVEVSGLPRSVLLSPTKSRNVSQIRWLTCRVARNEGHGLSEIGRRIGRDHKTVIYGLDQLSVWMARDPEYGELLAAITQRAREMLARRKAAVARDLQALGVAA